MSFYNKIPPKHADILGKGGDSIEYYHFGRFLYCSISYYGISGSSDDTITFYHGLSSKMVFRGLTAMFATPTSVTSSIRVAREFAGMDGIVFIIGGIFVLLVFLQ